MYLILLWYWRMSCWSSSSNSSKFHKGVIRSPLDILEMSWIQSPQVRRCKLRGSPQDEGICNFLSDEILHQHTSTAWNLHSHLLKLDGWKHGMLKPGGIFKMKKPPMNQLVSNGFCLPVGGQNKSCYCLTCKIRSSCTLSEAFYVQCRMFSLFFLKGRQAKDLTRVQEILQDCWITQSDGTSQKLTGEGIGQSGRRAESIGLCGEGTWVWFIHIFSIFSVRTCVGVHAKLILSDHALWSHHSMRTVHACWDVEMVIALLSYLLFPRNLRTQ